MDFVNRLHRRHGCFLPATHFYIPNLSLLLMCVKPTYMCPCWILSESRGRALFLPQCQRGGDKNDCQVEYLTKGVKVDQWRYFIIFITGCQGAKAMPVVFIILWAILMLGQKCGKLMTI